MDLNNSKHSTCYENFQGRDAKLIGDTGPSEGKYLTKKNGKRAFVIAESCNNASGNPRKLRKRRVEWPDPKIVQCCNFWISDIQRFIIGECGGPCHSDDGEIFLEIAMPLLVARHIGYGRSAEDLNTMEWFHRFLPKLAAENPREWFLEAEQNVVLGFENQGGRPAIPKIDSISRALNLTVEKRQRYGLKFLPSVERPSHVRCEERNAKKREREAARRLAAGMTPRSRTVSADKPWVALGIGRSTYYRRVEAGDLPPHPAMKPVVAVEVHDGPFLRLFAAG